MKTVIPTEINSCKNVLKIHVFGVKEATLAYLSVAHLL